MQSDRSPASSVRGNGERARRHPPAGLTAPFEPSQRPGGGWQPPDGGPSAAMGSEGSRSRLPALIVVVLIAAGVGAFLLLSGDDESTHDPAGVVNTFFEAAEDHDCLDAVGLLSESSLGASRAEVVDACQSAGVAGVLRTTDHAVLVSTEVSDQSDSAATVAAEIRSGGERQTIDVHVVRERDAWRIDLGSVRGSRTGGAPE